MRSLHRTEVWPDRALRRGVLAIAASMAIVGMSLGALATSKGVPIWLTTVMAAAVFAGGSEFMAIGLMTAGAAPITAVLGGLLLNARHFPYGLAISEVLNGSWPRRLLGSHVMVDEAVAFALAERDPRRRAKAYWTAGIAIYTAWAPSVLVGCLIGRHVGDPAVFGLDAAFPSALIALIMPALADRTVARAAAVGALVAVGTTPLLPEGLPVLLALVGVAVALPLPRKGRTA